MKIGTKTVLFGVHCFFIHWFFVMISWWRLYGFPKDYRLWAAFFIHDLGYFGKPNLDSAEGELHPIVAAEIMHKLFDKPDSDYWYNFAKYHSRFLAKRDNMSYSPLCCADKLAIWMTPRWFYLIQANLSGEIHEYMKGQGARTPAGQRTQWQWLTDVQNYCKAWAIEHKEIKEDLWTGTKRDLIE